MGGEEVMDGTEEKGGWEGRGGEKSEFKGRGETNKGEVGAREEGEDLEMV